MESVRQLKRPASGPYARPWIKEPHFVSVHNLNLRNQQMVPLVKNQNSKDVVDHSTNSAAASDTTLSSKTNRISTTLSKFEDLDASTKKLSLNDSSPKKCSPSSNESSKISSDNLPQGNKFLNGKTLNSVSKNKYSIDDSPKLLSNGNRFNARSFLKPASANRSPVKNNIQPKSSDSLYKNLKNKKIRESKLKKPTIKKEDKDLLLKKLTPTEFRVTQEKVTERPYSNAYYRHWAEGVYRCRVCGESLFSSRTKFDSGSGWPAFYDVVDWGKITLKEDLSHVGGNLLLLVVNPDLARTEVSCAACHSHVGHVFGDGPKPTGQRFCVNSASLRFEPAQPDEPSHETHEERERKTCQATCADTVAPLFHMALPSNSCALGAKLCFRVPASDRESEASRT